MSPQRQAELQREIDQLTEQLTTDNERQQKYMHEKRELEARIVTVTNARAAAKEQYGIRYEKRGKLQRELDAARGGKKLKPHPDKPNVVVETVEKLVEVAGPVVVERVEVEKPLTKLQHLARLVGIKGKKK